LGVRERSLLAPLALAVLGPHCRSLTLGTWPVYPGMRLSPLSFSISSLPVRKVLPDWNRLSSDLCCWAPWWLFFLERRRTLPMSSEPSAKAW